MKRGVTVEGWREWKEEERQRMVVEYLREWYPGIENKRRFYFNSLEERIWYGPEGETGETIKMYSPSKEKKEDWILVGLKDLDYIKKLKRILEE